MKDVVNGTQSTIPCLWGYEYNRTVFRSSIITEWDLVCNRARLVDVAQITLMLGVLIGMHYLFIKISGESKGI